MEKKTKKIKLDTLCLNEAMLKRDGFRSWSYQYEGLDFFSPAEPDAFSAQEDRKITGIVIHWNLPRSLRTENVLVPNRWKVCVKDAGTNADVDAWIVESDCPNSGAQKALTPGNVFPTGSSYLLTPEQRQDMLSGADSLRRGADFDERAGAFVCQLGAIFSADSWQERSADMPLFLTAASPANPGFSQFVPHCRNIFSLIYMPAEDSAEYDITVEGWYSAPPPGQEDLICEGYVHRVKWERHGGIPADDPLQQIVDQGTFNVSMGNSIYEALTAMLESSPSAAVPGWSDAVSALLLDCPETLQTPDGAARRAQKGLMSGFTGIHSGTRYQAQEGSDTEAAIQNEAQSALEEEERTLRALQREMFDIWWKRGRFSFSMDTSGHSINEFAPYFDTSAEDSLISNLIRQFEKVRTLKEELPKPDERLKPIPAQTYYKSHNPVLLLLGVKPPHALNYDDREQEATYGEEYSLSWEPMYMEWRLGYLHVPFNDQNWTLTEDGYRLTGQAQGEKIEEYSGIALLGRQTQENFAKKLEEQLDQDDHIREMIDLLKKTPMLTVELEGTHEKLIQRDIRSFAVPGDESVTYKGKQYALSELLEPFAENAPFMNDNVLNSFYSVRGGQILIKDVILYDKFGRILNVVRSGSYSGLLLDDQFMVLPNASVKPTRNIYPNAQFPLELRPRLMQAARLKAETEQIEGIIQINELEHSIEIFAASGEALGIVRTNGTSAGSLWSPAPGSAVPKSMDEVKSISPVMAAWIASWEGQSADEYQAFLDHVEDALYDSKYQPHDLTGTAAYFSKPMVLVKASLSCVLEETPYHPQDWDSTFAEVRDPYQDVCVPFLVGDPIDTGDGLVSCYTGTDFRAVDTSEQNKELTLRPGIGSEQKSLYLLMDPTLPVYIHTALLPDAEIRLESKQIQPLLDGLQQFLAISPLLSRTQEEKLMLPLRAEEGQFCFVSQDQTEYEFSALKSRKKETDGSMEVFSGYWVRKGDGNNVG